MNLPAYPMAASRSTPGTKLKIRDERVIDFGCSMATEVLIRFPLQMKSNYQGILGKTFKRTNNASRSASATAHPSSDRLNFLLLMKLPPFRFGPTAETNQPAKVRRPWLTDSPRAGASFGPKFYPSGRCAA